MPTAPEANDLRHNRLTCWMSSRRSVTREITQLDQRNMRARRGVREGCDNPPCNYFEMAEILASAADPGETIA